MINGPVRILILIGVALVLLALLPFLGGSNIFKRRNFKEPTFSILRRSVLISWILLMISLGLDTTKVLLGFGSFSKYTIPSYFVQAIVFYVIGYLLSRFDPK
ncbi:hypothetical protein FEZ41_10620 [Lentilactobacillus parafarraginis]|uniref:Uncharacterized protein n=1 Tax=Lentilactobacillus parafarraginis TaxID=390842 RepID=A0A5R9CSR4_9LACO|nr:hypothetical protein [Lentilactobacillus parafarraginis]TLQ17950.1 hypothetical protein FEZ41_10620 [Lentilactobacillus parafarraginis]